MSETKQPWTPGTWESNYDEVDEVAEIVAVGQGHDGCSLHIVDVDGDNAKANGVLMAAAPDLARALAKFVLGYDHDLRRRGGQTAPVDPPVIASARAALVACGWQWGGR